MSLCYYLLLEILEITGNDVMFVHFSYSDMARSREECYIDISCWRTQVNHHSLRWLYRQNVEYGWPLYRYNSNIRVAEAVNTNYDY